MTPSQAYLEQLIKNLRERPTRKRQMILQRIPWVWHGSPVYHYERGWCDSRWYPAGTTEQSVSIVAHFCNDPLPHVRLAAVVALRKIAPFYHVAINELRTALFDPFVPVSINAARALMLWEKHALPARHELHELLSSPVRQLRWLAAASLAKSAPSDICIPYLLDAIRTNRSEFEHWLSALESLGVHAKCCMSDLVEIQQYIQKHQEQSSYTGISYHAYSDNISALIARLESLDEL